MLPEFPKVRDDVNTILMKKFKKMINFETNLPDFKETFQYEGKTMHIQRHDGSEETTCFSGMGVKLTINLEDLKQKGLRAIFDCFENAAKDLADQKVKLILSRLDEICEKSGQTYDAKGKPFSYDLLLDTLETIEFDFDEDGNPKLPTFLVGSVMHSKIQNLEVTPKEEERLNEIIEKKRHEWRSRESNRKLVK